MVSVARSTARCQCRLNRNEEVTALSELAERFPEHGFGKYFQIIRRRLRVWNHKKVRRVYCLIFIIYPGNVGGPGRPHNVPAIRAIRALERFAASRSYPSNLRLSNCPEFVALPSRMD